MSLSKLDGTVIEYDTTIYATHICKDGLTIIAKMKKYKTNKTKVIPWDRCAPTSMCFKCGDLW